jgi:hypothetical protein
MRYAGHRLSAADAELYRGLWHFVSSEREIHLTTLARAKANTLESA